MRDATIRLAFAGLAPRRVDALVARFGSVPDVVASLASGSVEIPSAIVDAHRVDGDSRRVQLDALGVRFIERGDHRYPARLDRYPGSPRWLFAHGHLPEAPSIALVGTRTCTTYGSELATRYGRVASGEGWVVVSGLARGIDVAAHRGAIGATPCIAVLGSGIDVVYPRRHRDVHEAILQAGGAVVSEFPPGTRPDAWRFPTRNRIIAGLSDVVTIVEAGATGGALITARIAIDLGVPVFAVPGDIDRPASVGTNALIRDGAFPVFGPDDLRTTLGLMVPFSAA